MAIVAVVTHKVKDFATWKKVYDGFKSTQTTAGVRAHSVMRASDDANKVLVTHTFDTLAAAKTFFANPALQAAMREGGVDISSVKIDYYDEVVSGAL